MIEAQLDVIEELGAARLCNLSVEDIPFSLVTDSRPSLATGTAVGITFATDQIHIFDGKTGRRIGRPLRSNEQSEPKHVQAR